MASALCCRAARVVRAVTKTVLVLRALALGDLLVAVPALRAVRRAFPGHRVVLATPQVLAPLVELTGAVDELLPTDEPGTVRLAGPPPDVAVNLHGAGPQSHAALDVLGPRRRIGLRAPGWDGPRWDEISAQHPHERERWCAVLAHHGVPGDPEDLTLPRPAPAYGLGPVVVHPGARYGSRRWPPDRFGAVAGALERAGRRVVVTGSAAEGDLARVVAGVAGLDDDRVLAGRTDLGQLCALVAGASLVVSGDTGIAHLASAFGTPSVVLFGPVDPGQWGPPAAGPHITLGDGSVRRGGPFTDDPDPALLAVEAEDVLQAAARLQTQLSFTRSPRHSGLTGAASDRRTAGIDR